jgi:transposase-like protein
MPWRCPACQTPIHHHDIENAPRPGARYRCHICRLELMLDRQTNRLQVTPIDEANDDSPLRRRLR